MVHSAYDQKFAPTVLLSQGDSSSATFRFNSLNQKKVFLKVKESDKSADQGRQNALNNKSETFKQILGLVLLVQCLVITLLTFMTIWNIFV